VDFELLDYRLVRCSYCKATIKVTHYEVHLGQPDEPDYDINPVDRVRYCGVAVTAG
jgi:hypothetical protein